MKCGDTNDLITKSFRCLGAWSAIEKISATETDKKYRVFAVVKTERMVERIVSVGHRGRAVLHQEVLDVRDRAQARRRAP